jgi:hypothetical protein
MLKWRIWTSSGDSPAVWPSYELHWAARLDDNVLHQLALADVRVPTCDIPEEKIHPVVLGSFKISNKEYFSENFEYSRRVDLVEIAKCNHHVLLTDSQDRNIHMEHTALLTLGCKEMLGHLLLFAKQLLCHDFLGACGCKS